MRALAATLAAAAAAAAHDGPDSRDLRRAHQSRPYADSHVAAGTPAGVFAAISAHVRRGAAATRACEEWGHGELNAVSRRLWGLRDPRLSAAYGHKNDKRMPHFDSFDYKERLWEEEGAELRAGTAAYNVTRDGKCAEVNMWYAHHLSAASRATVARERGFALPLMPVAAPSARGGREYTYQVQCTTCHLCSADPCPETNPVPAATRHAGEDPVCPTDNTTGLPVVWYNRSKRCDWDFDPPCRLCEGIGGYMWGDQEDEIKFGECEPLLKAEDIPADNVTNITLAWPMQFSMEAFNNQVDQLDEGGPFPGPLPCDGSHKFEAQYHQYYKYDGRPGQEQMMAEQTSNFVAPPFGANSGANISIRLWHRHDFDFFIETINPNTNSTLLCQCVGVPHNGQGMPVPKAPFAGAVKWNFTMDSVLIGRERVGLEADANHGPPTGWIERSIVADHWMLGPHHFWVEVSTNLMLRAFQPWNALQLFYNWDLTPPEEHFFELTDSCRAHFTSNLSCPAGMPPRRTPPPPRR